MKTFISPNKGSYSFHGAGVRWGILCTNHDGSQELLALDRRHFAIFEFKESARLFLNDPEEVDQNTRKFFKMKIVKLIETYTLAD